MSAVQEPRPETALVCPSCAGDLERWSPSGGTNPWYCPECQPGYTDPEPPSVRLLAVVLLIIAQPAGLYFEAREKLGLGK